MTSTRLYFDYMATTPVDPSVAKEMSSCLMLDGDFANPASHHALGQQAAVRVAKARTQFACAIGASLEEIIWTSGATEANNLAIKGAAEFYQRRGRHLITVTTEHKAVLDCFETLSRQGYRVSYLSPLASGLVDIDELKALITADTVLVSVMLVNNEIGVVQPIEAIGQCVKEAGAVFHVDAAQALGKVAIDLSSSSVDLMSFSAHKCYGPKGVGALYVRRHPRIHLVPQIHGGGHERGFRSGTLPTHQIVGFAAAATLVSSTMAVENERMSGYFNQVLDTLEQIGGVRVHGDLTARVPHTVNFSIEDVDGESLLYSLSALCLSTTSACTAASFKPSHVLTAIGVPDQLARSTVRFSMGRYTTDEALSQALALISMQVKRLRAMQP